MALPRMQVLGSDGVVSIKTCISGTGIFTEVVVLSASVAEEAPMGLTPTLAVILDHRTVVLEIMCTVLREWLNERRFDQKPEAVQERT